MLPGMTLPITFEYAVGVEDVLASYESDPVAGAQVRRQLRWTGVKIGVAGLVLLAAGITGSWLATYRGVQVPGPACTAGMVLGAIMLWFARPMVFMREGGPGRLQGLNPDRKSALEQLPSFRTAVGPQVLTISHDDIREERRHSALSVDWEEMDRVSRGPSHLFFHRVGGSSFILPHAAMNGVDPSRLADEVDRLIAAKREPPADPAAVRPS